MVVTARQAVPDTFSAIWRRTDLVIGDQADDDHVVDDAEVIWLQAGSWYADLRIPHVDDGGPIEAFAGPATWLDPSFTWEHTVDWLGTFPSDVGTLTWLGDDLVEQGIFERDGAEVPYREVWRRSSPAAPRSAYFGEHVDGGVAAIVRVGPVRLSLADTRSAGGGFAVRREDLIAGRFTTTFVRAIDAPEPPAMPAGATAPTGIEVDGWELEAVEWIGER